MTLIILLKKRIAHLNLFKMSFLFVGISDYHERLLNRTVTIHSEVQRCLQTICEFREVNAFVEVFEKEALDRAIVLDKLVHQNKFLPLIGVVIGIKDNICYEGHISSASSLMLKNHVSLYSSTVVQRLLSLGAIIIGRLNCDEFAMGSSNENSFYGSVRNPSDLDFVAGGSSGGCAAAVSFGGCHLSLGTDTGGSVRQPASFCGVIGVKPTYGRVSRHGIIAFASSFDQVGVFGKSIEDVSLVTEVISGQDEHDSTCSSNVGDDLRFDPKGFLDNPDVKYNLAFCESWFENTYIDKKFKSKFKEYCAIWTDAGHTLTPFDLSFLELLIPTYYILSTAEASSNLGRYTGFTYGYRDIKPGTIEEILKLSRSKGFGNEVQRRILLGTFVLSEGYFDAYYVKAQKVRRILHQEITNIFENCDGFLSPTTLNSAFKLNSKIGDPLSMYLEDQFTVLANLVGSPAISIPFAFSQAQMPIGIQLMFPKWQEKNMFMAAKTIQNLMYGI